MAPLCWGCAFLTITAQSRSPRAAPPKKVGGRRTPREMMRFAFATPGSRAARALLGVGAAIVLAVAASGCASSSPAAVPTPDPFSGLAERSDQAYHEGLDLYGQSKFR